MTVHSLFRRWISVSLAAGALVLAGRGFASEAGAVVDAVEARRAEVQAAVERTAAAYAAAVSEVLGRVVLPPAIVVANTPYLAAYDRQSRRILIPYWPPQESTVAFFLDLTDGDEARAEALFVELFNGFLVGHELTHWLLEEQGVEGDHFTSEVLANEGAVAFLRLSPDGEPRLGRLDALLADALERLSDPTPVGLDPPIYFNAFYPSLATDPRQYGYYQFQFIRDAIARQGDLDFAAFVASLAVRGVCGEG